VSPAAFLSAGALGVLIGAVTASWFGWPTLVVLLACVGIVVAVVTTRLT
jgi:hypothetical protein